jgi:putative Mg2+ transporter-C (MgtC) family protein
MDTVWSELGWETFDAASYIRTVMRLVAAGILAGVIGWERKRRGREAGMRTHMLVGLGAAMFTIVPVTLSPDMDFGNIVKGVAAGIGFLGAGTILKDVEHQNVEGLTTAASIWFAAAIGLATGAGMYFAATVGTIIALIVLMPMRKVEPPPAADSN